jgi:hypothetical protein
MHRLFDRILLFPFRRILAHVRFTCAASANCSRGIRLCLLALASIELPIHREVVPFDQSGFRTTQRSLQRVGRTGLDSWKRPWRFLENVE